MALINGAFIVCGCLMMAQLSYAQSTLTQTCPGGADSECTASVANSRCYSKTCYCDIGYRADTSTSCTKILDGACTTNGGECNSLGFATCSTSSKCTCMAPTTTADSNICKNALDQPCSIGMTCITNAECLLSAQKCACKRGYTSVSGSCISNAAETQRMTSVLLAVCSLVAGLRKVL